ncbi:MAG: hypothetical protein ACFFBP_12850 [Promethearchaeota archaeon]
MTEDNVLNLKKDIKKNISYIIIFSIILGADIVLGISMAIFFEDITSFILNIALGMVPTIYIFVFFQKVSELLAKI